MLRHVEPGFQVQCQIAAMLANNEGMVCVVDKLILKSDSWCLVVVVIYVRKECN